MKHLSHATDAKGFKVLMDGGSSQAAVMVLPPGESSSDEPENEHPRAEQWVYVVSGAGTAKSNHRRIAIKAGSLLLIEKGEAHQITATGKTPLVTLNLYAPPAYTREEEVRPAVKRRRERARLRT